MLEFLTFVCWLPPLCQAGLQSLDAQVDAAVQEDQADNRQNTWTKKGKKGQANVKAGAEPCQSQTSLS